MRGEKYQPLKDLASNRSGSVPEIIANLNYQVHATTTLKSIFDDTLHS
jgi:hypothetical protein